MNAPDNPPAFPAMKPAYMTEPGMSLRDYFAAAAPIPASFTDDEAHIHEMRRNARARYYWADAMLTARTPET